MKKSRFTEHHIVAILNEGEAGIPVKDVCRKQGHQLGDLLQVEVEVWRA